MKSHFSQGHLRLAKTTNTSTALLSKKSASERDIGIGIQSVADSSANNVRRGSRPAVTNENKSLTSNVESGKIRAAPRVGQKPGNLPP